MLHVCFDATEGAAVALLREVNWTAKWLQQQRPVDVTTTGHFICPGPETGGGGYDASNKGTVERNATSHRLMETSGLPWSIDKCFEGLSSQKMLQQWKIS